MMRQVLQQPTVTRPASRSRARSPGAPATWSAAAAYGYQGNAPANPTPNSEPVRGTGSQGLRSNTTAGSTRASMTRGSGVGASLSSDTKASRLAVVVRKRPMNRREVQGQQQDVLLCRNNAVVVREPKLKVDLTRYVEEHNFLFDQTFDESVTNEMLYLSAIRPIIDAVFQRGKCTCFAYGQTGSGKTYTMMGPPKAHREGPNGDKTPGIFLLAAQDIFGMLQQQENSHLGVYIAFYEIYCGKLFDLLNNRQLLHARENAKGNVIIVGLQEHLVENVQELMEVIEYGLNSRTTGITGANVDSSRSHAILQICLKDTQSRGKDDASRAREHGKISFIDLAGSERGADTLDIDRQTRMDGAEINKSLLALKECIRALDQQNNHTPFRGSKLTQVLKDSFIGGNCRTVMIANVSPCGCTVEHTLNTLRYAYRVKELRRPNSNPQASAEMGTNSTGVTGGVHRELEEISSEGECSDRSDEPLGVQQQLRVAHLAADAQTITSPLRGDPVVGIGGAEHGRIFDLAPRTVQQQLQPEEVITASRYVPVQRCNAGPEAHTEVSPTSVQSQELPPEVALEPVGCSQAALDELARQHDRLIGTILAEEEELITAHRQHIDMMVELIKEEMVHLNSVDRPGSDVDAYVNGIDRILRLKATYIGDIRQRVDMFKEHLSQEDSLSRKFQTLASQAN